jgi:glucose dehydrogenase
LSQLEACSSFGATNDGKFRAFDKETGEELWMTQLPASAFASPITYQGHRTGKQFVVIAAGGGDKYDKKIHRQFGCVLTAVDTMSSNGSSFGVYLRHSRGH